MIDAWGRWDSRKPRRYHLNPLDLDPTRKEQNRTWCRAENSQVPTSPGGRMSRNPCGCRQPPSGLEVLALATAWAHGLPVSVLGGRTFWETPFLVAFLRSQDGVEKSCDGSVVGLGPQGPAPSPLAGY